MTWMETLATNGHRCGLSGCSGHCSGCGLRYHGSLCHGPSCGGCSPRRVDTEEAFVPTLRSTDILCEHHNNRVLLLVKSLVGQSRPVDETAWHLALRAEKIAELRENPVIKYLPRGEELKHELILITVVLEQVYDLPPPPSRWGINP